MFKVRMFVIFAVIMAVVVACGARGSGDFQVMDVWARPGLSGGNSAVFFLIINPGPEDLLVSATSEVADAVELHKTVVQDGEMQMFQQTNVPVSIGETAFKPGGLHVMLIGLKNDLKPGDTFTLTLNFEKSGERILNVAVSEP